MTTSAASDRTEVGNYFIANYPPFSVWKRRRSRRTRGRRWRRRRADVPLGLYLHIPFCRKRCHFCYFRVYTDKNATEVQGYLDVLAREWELYSAAAAIAGRPLNFVYFGGGTPSYISTAQLESLVAADGRRQLVALGGGDHLRVRAGHAHREQAARRSANIGVTRLSLGVENFDDAILEANGRAHRSGEIGTRLRVRAVARLPADQHRSHRRHAGRDRRELARLRAARRSTWRPTASPSTRWSCRSTRRSARTC